MESARRADVDEDRQDNRDNWAKTVSPSRDGAPNSLSLVGWRVGEGVHPPQSTLHFLLTKNVVVVVVIAGWLVE